MLSASGRIARLAVQLHRPMSAAAAADPRTGKAPRLPLLTRFVPPRTCCRHIAQSGAAWRLLSGCGAQGGLLAGAGRDLRPRRLQSAPHRCPLSLPPTRTTFLALTPRPAVVGSAQVAGARVGGVAGAVERDALLDQDRQPDGAHGRRVPQHRHLSAPTLPLPLRLGSRGLLPACAEVLLWADKSHPNLIEIGICMVGVEWVSQFEVYAHFTMATDSGVSDVRSIAPRCSFLPTHSAHVRGAERGRRLASCCDIVSAGRGLPT